MDWQLAVTNEMGIIDQIPLLTVRLFWHNPMSCPQSDNACVCRDMYMHY